MPPFQVIKCPFHKKFVNYPYHCRILKAGRRPRAAAGAARSTSYTLAPTSNTLLEGPVGRAAPGYSIHQNPIVPITTPFTNLPVWPCFLQLKRAWTFGIFVLLGEGECLVRISLAWCCLVFCLVGWRSVADCRGRTVDEMDSAGIAYILPNLLWGSRDNWVSLSPEIQSACRSVLVVDVMGENSSRMEPAAMHAAVSTLTVHPTRNPKKELHSYFCIACEFIDQVWISIWHQAQTSDVFIWLPRVDQ